MYNHPRDDNFTANDSRIEVVGFQNRVLLIRLFMTFNNIKDFMTMFRPCSVCFLETKYTTKNVFLVFSWPRGYLAEKKSILAIKLHHLFELMDCKFATTSNLAVSARVVSPYPYPYPCPYPSTRQRSNSRVAFWSLGGIIVSEKTHSLKQMQNIHCKYGLLPHSLKVVEKSVFTHQKLSVSRRRRRCWFLEI